MAALHATMTNSRGNTVSTIRHDYVETMAETWEVRIETTLWKDGTYKILVTDRDTGKLLQQIDGQYPLPQKEETTDDDEVVSV